MKQKKHKFKIQRKRATYFMCRILKQSTSTAYLAFSLSSPEGRSGTAWKISEVLNFILHLYQKQCLSLTPPPSSLSTVKHNARTRRCNTATFKLFQVAVNAFVVAEK
jgi:hypothetical protein